MCQIDYNTERVKNKHLTYEERIKIETLYKIKDENNRRIYSISEIARIINVKDLMQSPYNVLIELLIGGPKNDKLNGVFPENTKLLNSSIESECLTLDFSSEILNYSKDDAKTKENLIKSIVNTVRELTEVNKVKILVNGQPTEDFPDEYVRG